MAFDKLEPGVLPEPASPETNSAAPDFSAEERRIRQTYASRRRDIPKDRYSRFNRGHLLTMQKVEREVLSGLARSKVTSLADKDILEVGCGTGEWLRTFLVWGARPEAVAGVDLLEEDVAEARRLLPREVRLQAGNASHLPFADNSFDLVFQFTVFSSILDTHLRRKVAAEMLRVLRPDGLLVWFDLAINNPRNPEVRFVPKNEIGALFPACRIQLKRLTLLTPVARVMPRLASLLSQFTLFPTHYLGLITRRADGTGSTGSGVSPNA